MKKTDYVVVATNPRMVEVHDYHIYSKHSPDKEVMLAYAKTIQMKYPHKRVYVMTYGKAREQQIKFYEWRKAQEQTRLDRCDRNLNNLLTKMAYSDTIKRVAER